MRAILEEVNQERKRQNVKWGVQNHNTVEMIQVAAVAAQAVESLDRQFTWYVTK